MGAWGEGPLENDTALDFMYHLDKLPMSDVIDLGLNSKDYDEIRAACWLLEKLDVVFDYCNKKPAQAQCAVKKLSEIATDNEWLDRWTNKKAIHTSVMAQIVALSGR